MRVIECRSCGKPHRIVPVAKQDGEYSKKIQCFDCWTDVTYGKKKSQTSVKVGRKSSGNRPTYVTDKDSGNEFQTVYEVGDSVFINTDKYGVLLCQILDTECWNDGAHIFYSVDVKGTVVDYVEEDELYNSAQEAKNGAQVKVF